MGVFTIMQKFIRNITNDHQMRPECTALARAIASSRSPLVSLSKVPTSLHETWRQNSHSDSVQTFLVSQQQFLIAYE